MGPCVGTSSVIMARALNGLKTMRMLQFANGGGWGIALHPAANPHIIRESQRSKPRCLSVRLSRATAMESMVFWGRKQRWWGRDSPWRPRSLMLSKSTTLTHFTQKKADGGPWSTRERGRKGQESGIQGARLPYRKRLLAVCQLSRGRGVCYDGGS